MFNLIFNAIGVCAEVLHLHQLAFKKHGVITKYFFLFQTSNFKYSQSYSCDFKVNKKEKNTIFIKYFKIYLLVDAYEKKI